MSTTWTHHQQPEKQGVGHKAVNTNTQLSSTASSDRQAENTPFVGAFNSPRTCRQPQIYRNAQLNEWFVCSLWIQTSLLLSKHIWNESWVARSFTRLNQALRVLQLKLTGLWRWTVWGSPLSLPLRFINVQQNNETWGQRFIHSSNHQVNNSLGNN